MGVDNLPKMQKNFLFLPLLAGAVYHAVCLGRIIAWDTGVYYQRPLAYSGYGRYMAYLGLFQPIPANISHEKPHSKHWRIRG